MYYLKYKISMSKMCIFFIRLDLDAMIIIPRWPKHFIIKGGLGGTILRVAVYIACILLKFRSNKI